MWYLNEHDGHAVKVLKGIAINCLLKMVIRKRREYLLLIDLDIQD